MTDGNLARSPRRRRTTVRECKTFNDEIVGNACPGCGRPGRLPVQKKAAPAAGQCGLEPPVMTGTERNNLRRSYRAFPFPTAAFLSLRCYRRVTLLWRLHGSIFRKKPAPGVIR